MSVASEQAAPALERAEVRQSRVTLRVPGFSIVVATGNGFGGWSVFVHADAAKGHSAGGLLGAVHGLESESAGFRRGIAILAEVREALIDARLESIPIPGEAAVDEVCS